MFIENPFFEENPWIICTKSFIRCIISTYSLRRTEQNIRRIVIITDRNITSNCTSYNNTISRQQNEVSVFILIAEHRKEGTILQKARSYRFIFNFNGAQCTSPIVIRGLTYWADVFSFRVSVCNRIYWSFHNLSASQVFLEPLMIYRRYFILYIIITLTSVLFMLLLCFWLYF